MREQIGQWRLGRRMTSVRRTNEEKRGLLPELSPLSEAKPGGGAQGKGKRKEDRD